MNLMGIRFGIVNNPWYSDTQKNACHIRTMRRGCAIYCEIPGGGRGAAGYKTGFYPKAGGVILYYDC